jgi:hypothetical protein
MIHHAAQLQKFPVLAQDGFETAVLGKLPPGARHYEFVSTSSASGACISSIEMTSCGFDQKPKIVSTSSGNCEPQDRVNAPVRPDALVQPPTSRLTTSPSADSVARAQVGTII